MFRAKKDPRRVILDCEAKFKNENRFRDPVERVLVREPLRSFFRGSTQARRFSQTGEDLISESFSKSTAGVKWKTANRELFCILLIGPRLQKS